MKAKMVMVIMAVALAALPAMAQNMEWQSTSTMRAAGNYTAPVTAVGATSAASAATTTYSPAQAPSGPRRGFDTGAETGQSEEYPIGDAVLPLMVMALAFAGVVYFRKKARA